VSGRQAAPWKLREGGPALNAMWWARRNPSCRSATLGGRCLCLFFERIALYPSACVAAGRYLQANRLSGQLPGSWGSNGSWPLLSYLYLSNNMLGGGYCSASAATRPAALLDCTASPLPCCPAACVSMTSAASAVPSPPAGTLLPEWGQPGSFSSLRVLHLNDSQLTGGCLPACLHKSGCGGCQAAAFRPLALAHNTACLSCLAAQAPCLLSGATAGCQRWRQCEWPLLAAAASSIQLMPLATPRCLHSTLPVTHARKACHAHACRFLERNSLSRTVPPQWANLSSLSRLTLRPGNAKLCGPLPAGLPFAICTDEDISCLKDRPTLLEGSCAAAAGGGAAPRPSPAPPDSGGGGVSAVAIAVPVAVGAALLAAAAGCCAWAAVRRRRRQRRQQEDEELRAAARARSMAVSWEAGEQAGGGSCATGRQGGVTC
jgi:hypothetical protein